MNESPEEQKLAEATSKPDSGKRVLVWLRARQNLVILFLAAIIITILSSFYYFTTMLGLGNPGFTLDDSWIHLQFARTIYEGTPWIYSPGYPSTGSTSPLWSIVLSPIFLFVSDTVSVVWGVLLVSLLFFIMCSYLVGYIVFSYTEHVTWGVVGILGFVIIPRNTWLMLSGMETPLFMLVLLTAIILLDKDDLKTDLLLGVVAGVAYLSRPEGVLVAVLLIPLRFLMLIFRHKVDRRRILALFASGLIALVIVAPWIMYCLSVTGFPLPDTFYAKVHPPTPLELEAWDIWWNIFVREMGFLMFGFIGGAYMILRGRPFPWILALAMTILYRLSTPYASLINNARYLVPIFGLFFISAVVFSAWLIRAIMINILKLKDDFETGYLSTVVIVLVLLTPLIPTYMWQATDYSKAVRTINDMHVGLGAWMAENTPEDAIFATHDAGAIRYISGRRMIDIAGLLSPDIIHGNMTSTQTLSYLRQQGCNYFVIFNELFLWWRSLLPWNAYETLYTVHIPPEIYSSAGRDTMSVYRIYWENTSY